MTNQVLKLESKIGKEDEMKNNADIKIFEVNCQYDKRALQQLERCCKDAVKGVLCADHHVGYSQPIGGAVAYIDKISPSGVGYDIGCGNKAVRTNVKAKDVPIDKIMDLIYSEISFGMGRNNKDEDVSHPVLDRIKEANFEPQRKLYQKAADQLGTVGSGNHYVDLFEDEEGWLWVGVHFGSRGFGHKTATGFMSLSQGKGFDDKPDNESMDDEPVLFDVHTDIGQAYIEAMTLAGDYAYAGRDWVVDKVLSIIGAQVVESVHNHHNFAWLENHGGQDVWVVRKGCTPAFPGQKGFVGGSMGDISVILEGVDGDEARDSLYSTVHGAGRVMSRTQAAGKSRIYRRFQNNVDGDDTFYHTREQALKVDGATDAKKVYKKRVIKEGLIDWGSVKGSIASQGIELRGGGADEAPAAYKDLTEVLKSHSESINVLHRLRPVGVAMAGVDTFDLYKD